MSFLLLLLWAGPGAGQTYVDLKFTGNIQATNGLYPNNSTLGPEYYSGWVFDFREVATWNGHGVDARLTVTSTSGSYGFVGWLPNYNKAAGQPEGDLGFYHRFTGNYGQATGGTDFTLQFFEGGETFATPVTLPAIRLLLYDVDGEATQSEQIRLFLGDGLSGYRLGPVSDIVATPEGGSMVFRGPGHNHHEDNADGGLIAYYLNASTVHFQMRTTTTESPEPTWGLFTAIDGDASLVAGRESTYGSLVSVPEPAAPWLLGVGILFRRRREGQR